MPTTPAPRPISPCGPGCLLIPNTLSWDIGSHDTCPESDG